MAIITTNMFYLGNLTVTDTNDGNFTNENADAILGAYSKPPIISVDNHDLNNDGIIRDDEDNPAGDYISYDVGSGTVNQVVESTQNYTADVLLGDGSTISLEVMVVQTQNGDTFLVDIVNSDELQNQSIQSITLTAASTDWGGYWAANSTVEGASVVCFTAATLIETTHGPVRADALSTSDPVLTVDHGAQPVREVIHRILQRPGRNAPISLDPTTLGYRGTGPPLRVSPQHRILMPGISGTNRPHEVLVAARKLLPLSNVHQAPGWMPVHYVHLLLDRHEIVTANGMAAETLLMGPQSQRIIGGRCGLSTAPARTILEQREAREFVGLFAAHHDTVV